MGTLITGPDPNQAAWPVLIKPVAGGTGLTRPTGDVLVGTGSYPTILSDGSDANYIHERTSNLYYRINCGSFNLPVNARVTSAQPTIRGRLHTGNTKYKDSLVIIGDHSAPGGKANLIGSTIHFSPSTVFQTFNGRGVSLNSQGKPFTQADLAAGIYICFGLNGVYNTLTSVAGCDWSQASIKFTYDLPPSSNITFPVSGGTISNTSAPIITWDYSDDFQPQAKYQVTVFDSVSNKVYDSGLVVSSDTFHAMKSNLANGNYTVNVMVYQAWNGPGGDFPANAVATLPFTIQALTLGAPRLSLAVVNEHTEVTIYPDVNLISFDTSTQDNGYLGWFHYLSNCTLATTAAPVRDGSNSVAITISATATPSIGNSPLEVPVQPGSSYKLQSYLHPGALTNRQAQMGVMWYASNGTQIASGFGPLTTLAVSSWTQVSATGMVAPSGAAYAQVRLQFGTVSVNDVIYLDDAGMWWQIDTATLPAWSRGGFFESTVNLLRYADSTIDNNHNWGIDPAAPTTTIGVSSTQALHGAQSLNLSNSATAAAAIQAILPNAYTPVVAGQQYHGIAWCYSATNARSAQVGMYWYKADFTASATASSNASTGSATANSWFRLAGNVTAPSDAAYGIPFYGFLAVPQNEQKYVDAISFYPVQPGSMEQDFIRGAYPNTDSSPTLLTEYSDDGGVTWKTLNSQPVYALQGSYLIYDYTIKHNYAGNQRSYRASLSQVENGISLNSPNSSASNTAITLSNAWMHFDSDPVNTSYNYKWDGHGRAETMDAGATTVALEGRAYPFAQYSVQTAGSLDITLHLDSQSDMSALKNLALAKGLVVFRDQRGRSYRGYMGTVKFQDAQYGVAQDATFTLQLSGDQP